MPQLSQPSVALGVSIVDDSLPTHEIHLHISIKELSLVDFMLAQISLLKETAAQGGGVVPLIITKLLVHKQVTPYVVMSISAHQPSSLVCSDCNSAIQKSVLVANWFVVLLVAGLDAPLSTPPLVEVG
jgi:hypothetical protein